VITFPSSLLTERRTPVARHTAQPSDATVPVTSPVGAPYGVLLPRGASRPAGLDARLSALRSAGWLPEEFLLPGTHGEPAAAEVDALLAALRAAGCSSVDVWAQEPEPVLEVVEALWHRSLVVSVVLDVDVLSSRSRVALAAGAGVTNPEATALLEAAAYADVVVLDGRVPTGLLTRGRPPFGSISLAEADSPVHAPRQVVLEPGPQLTVVVSSYDRPEALRACLDGLTRQSLPSSAFEVLVVDDASPHPVTDLVAGYSERLPVRLLQLTENHGPGGARTRALDHVRTPLTLLMDDDDLPEPRCVEEHLLAHQENPGEDVAVLGGTSVLPDGAMTALSRHVMTVGRQYFAYPEVRAGELNPWRAFWCGRSSAKTTLLRRHGLRTRFMEDADFAFRARADGLRVLYAKRAVQVVTERLDLDSFRRRQNRIGHAMLDLARSCQDDEVWTWMGLEPVARQLVQWVGQRELVGHIIDQLSPLPVARLRSTPHEGGTMLALLDAALFMELDAHYAAGLLAGLARQQALAHGRPLLVGMRHDDPETSACLTATAGEEWVRPVVLFPDATAAVDFQAAAAAGGLLIGNVELRVCGNALEALADLDLLLAGSLPAQWRTGMAVPLIGQDVASWVDQLRGARSPRGALR